VPEGRVTTVGHFRALAQRAEGDGHLRQKLLLVLKLSREKWEEACEHAARAVAVGGSGAPTSRGARARWGCRWAGPGSAWRVVRSGAVRPADACLCGPPACLCRSTTPCACGRRTARGARACSSPAATAASTCSALRVGACGGAAACAAQLRPVARSGRPLLSGAASGRCLVRLQPRRGSSARAAATRRPRRPGAAQRPRRRPARPVRHSAAAAADARAARGGARAARARGRLLVAAGPPRVGGVLRRQRGVPAGVAFLHSMPC
jgi:hypothetical protein